MNFYFFQAVLSVIFVIPLPSLFFAENVFLKFFELFTFLQKIFFTVIFLLLKKSKSPYLRTILTVIFQIPFPSLFFAENVFLKFFELFTFLQKIIFTVIFLTIKKSKPHYLQTVLSVIFQIPFPSLFFAENVFLRIFKLFLKKLIIFKELFFII